MSIENKLGLSEIAKTLDAIERNSAEPLFAGKKPNVAGLTYNGDGKSAGDFKAAGVSRISPETANRRQIETRPNTGRLPMNGKR